MAPAPAPASLELEPELSSVRRARHWVTESLPAHDPDLVDTVVLLTSELVTNALLYAPGPIRVAIESHDGTVRVWVSDTSPVEPLPKTYDREALTGRGLDLLTVLADTWGVDPEQPGKSVWFRIGPSGDGVSPAGAAEDERRPDPSTFTDIQGDPEPQSDSDEMVTVRILRLPLDIYQASEEHNDALMREFALISRDPAAASVRSQLVELVAEIEGFFGPQVSASRAQISAAAERGDAHTDLHLRMHPSNRHYVERIVELLNEADRFCREGDLLTLAAPPDILRFRAWYMGQVIGQLDGAEPTPWPG